MDAAPEVAKPLPESHGGPAAASGGVGAKELGDGSNAGSVGAGGVNNSNGNGGFRGNNLGLLGGDLHEHSLFKHVHGEVNSLGKLPDNFLRQTSDGQGEVVNVHLGDDDVGPSRLQSIDKVKHENSELGRSKARAGGDAPRRGDESGVNPIDADGASEPVRSEAKPRMGMG